MAYYTLTFKLEKRIHADDLDEFSENIEFLLEAYKRNGQVINYYFLETATLINQRAFLLTPEDHSLEVALDSIHATRFKEILQKYFNCSLEISMIDAHLVDYSIPKEVDSCLLKWGDASPLLSMDTLIPIPLYFFSKTSTDKSNYEDIRFWEADYEACYGIWFRSSINESFFFDQLSNIKSDLNKYGRSLAAKIYNLTGKRCYYYLFSYPSEDPPNQCPGCSLPWTSTQKIQYKCDNCNLVMGDLSGT